MSKRIGIVLRSLPTYSETFFRSKISGLVKSGCKVFIFVANSDLGALYDAKVIQSWPTKIYDIKLSFIFRFLYLFLLRPLVVFKFLKLESKDAVPFIRIVKNLYINGSIFSINLDWLHFGFDTQTIGRENVAKAMGAQMGVSVRGFDVCLSPLKNPKMYDKLWSKDFKLHYISNDLLNKSLELGFRESASRMKITPAIDFSEFSNPDKINSTIEQPIKILTVARLHWKKGLEYAIDAMGILKRLGYEFTYTIIGDGSEYERLCFATYQNHILDEVIFAGKRNSEFVKNAMWTSDVFLMPSVSEGFCNAVLEAQASGLLCIVSDAEGLSENVIHGATGWVVNKRSPKQLAERIANTINLENKVLSKIRLQAVSRVKSEFSLKDQKSKWNQFFKQNNL